MDAHTNTYREKVQEANVASRLLAWYDTHHRDLPWRIPPRDIARGVRPDPYRVWLSEVMLQQTTVEAVKSYFSKFTARWPTVADLAAAETDDVMRQWAGLGYYSRARNLKKCADAVAALPEGRFPDTEDGLRELPGIGAYTAAAVASIAFNRPAVVVDGNVERVVSRLFRIETPLPAAKTEIGRLVGAMLPADRPGDYAQAMMDLGATICSPRRPKCMICPVRDDCQALASGDPELFPVKAPKRDKPLRRGAAFVAVRSDGAVLLRKRPETGMLGSMAEPPTTGWSARQDGETGATAAPFKADWLHAGTIRHVFTHFELALEIWRADAVSLASPQGWWWSPRAGLMAEALPTVMKKAIEAAIPGATRRSDPEGDT
jgi:A/G-specific adenine glycosylase